MKKVAIVLLMVLVPSIALAVVFSPSPMTIEAPAEQEYAFEGSAFSMPITIAGGMSAKIVFMVYTLNKGDMIGTVRNGYLGWHYVNKIDTCLYVAPPQDCIAGSNTITWNGQDTYGTILADDSYTYYIWGYDNVSPRQKATSNTIMIDRNRTQALQYDAATGAVIDPPVLWAQNPNMSMMWKWTLGNDNESDAHMETCDGLYAWGVGGDWGSPRIAMPWAIDIYNSADFYRTMVNTVTPQLGLFKHTWVAGSVIEEHPEWGAALRWSQVPFGRGAGRTCAVPQEPIVYCTAWAGGQTVPAGYSFIVDYDQDLELAGFVEEWFVDMDLYNAALIDNPSHGPDFSWVDEVSGRFYLGSWSCQNICFNPLAMVNDGGGYYDMTLWANLNGDFYYDKNYTGESPTWICFGGTADALEAAGRAIYADKNGFYSRGMSGAAGISGLIFGPDGTGIVKYTWADELGVVDANNEAEGVFFINNGTQFDGAYTDFSNTAYNYTGVWYVAYDSVTGTIVPQPDVAVDDAAPAAFAVAQNSPNPFNPTTTINFTIPESGTVTVDIFNVAGQKVASLVNGQMNAGSHSVVWNASSCSAGVYFYTVKAGNHTKTMKMTLLK